MVELDHNATEEDYCNGTRPVARIDHQRDRKLSEIIVHQRKLEVATIWCHIVQAKQQQQRQMFHNEHDVDIDHLVGGDEMPDPHEQLQHHQHHRLDSHHMQIKMNRTCSPDSRQSTMSAIRVVKLLLGKYWPKESRNLSKKKKQQVEKPTTKMARATIVSTIFIQLLFAYTNFAVITCEQTTIQLRAIVAPQQLMDDAAWIETKHLNHRHAANPNDGTTTTTNRRMDEDEDGESDDDDDEDNETNESAYSLIGASGPKLSPKRTRRNDVDSTISENALASATGAAKQVAANANDKQLAPATAAASKPFGVKIANTSDNSERLPAAAAAADPKPSSSYDDNNNGISNKVHLAVVDRPLHHLATSSTGQQLRAKFEPRRRETQAASSHGRRLMVAMEPKSESRYDEAPSSGQQQQPEPKLSLAQKRFLDHLKAEVDVDGATMRPQVALSANNAAGRRNNDATLKAKANLRSTMTQLHFNKTLNVLERPTQQHSGAITSINDDSNLLPSEFSEVSVYARLDPLVDNNNNNNGFRQRSQPVISVSATRAPVHPVDYHPPSNNNKRLHGSDLLVAADESQQRRYVTTKTAFRPAARFDHFFDDDQWGRRKSSISTGSKSEPTTTTTTTSTSTTTKAPNTVVQLANKPADSKRGANVEASIQTKDGAPAQQQEPAYADIVTWTPAAGQSAYRAASAASHSATSGGSPANITLEFNNQQQSDTNQPNQQEQHSFLETSVKPLNVRQPSVEHQSSPMLKHSDAPTTAMGADPSESYMRGWHQLAPPVAPPSRLKDVIMEPQVASSRWPLQAAAAKLSPAEPVASRQSHNLKAPQKTLVTNTDNDDSDDNEPDDDGPDSDEANAPPPGSAAGRPGQAANAKDSNTPLAGSKLRSPPQDPILKIVGGSAAAGERKRSHAPNQPTRQSDWPVSMELNAADKLPEMAKFEPADNAHHWSPTTTNRKQVAADEANDVSDKFRAHRASGYGTKSVRLPAPVAANALSTPVMATQQNHANEQANPSMRQTNSSSPDADGGPLTTQQQQQQQHPLPAPIVRGADMLMSQQQQQQLLHPFGTVGTQQHAMDKSPLAPPHTVPSGSAGGPQRFRPPGAPARAFNNQMMRTVHSSSMQHQQFSPFLMSPHQQSSASIRQQPVANGLVPANPERMDPESLRGQQLPSEQRAKPKSPAAAASASLHQNSSATLSITTFPYPAPATDALNYFSVYPHHQHNWHRQRFSSPVGGTLEHAGQSSSGYRLPKAWHHSHHQPATSGLMKAAGSAAADERASQLQQAADSSMSSQVNQRKQLSANQTVQAAAPKQHRDLEDVVRETNPNGFLTINLRTHAAVGPNQLFWEAAAREVAQSSSPVHGLEPAAGRVPVSNAHLPPQHRELPAAAASAGGSVLRRPMRYALGAVHDDTGGRGSSRETSRATNGHAYAGMPTKRPPVALGLRSLAAEPAHFGDFVHLAAHHQPEFSYLESAAPHGFYPIAIRGPPAAALHHMASEMGPNGFHMAAAAAVPVSAFVVPPSTQPATGGSLHHAQQSSSQHGDSQFLKKGQAIISAALPLATPAAVSDAFGWPMGYGSEAAKSLIKVNHVAPPPAYLIPAKVAVSQSSAYLYPTMIDLKHGSSAPIKEDASTIIGSDHLAYPAESDAVDEFADENWPGPHQLLGQHSVLRPQIWGVSPSAAAAASSFEPQKVNQVRVKLSTRPPAAKRLSLWRRLRLFRNNRSSGSSGSNSKNSHDPIDSADQQIETNNSTMDASRRFDVKLRHKRSLRERVNNMVNTLKQAARAVTPKGQTKKDTTTNNNNKKSNQPPRDRWNPVQLGSSVAESYLPAAAAASNKQTSSNRARSHTSYIPLVDNDQLIATLESELLAHALLLNDQYAARLPLPPPRVQLSAGSGNGNTHQSSSSGSSSSTTTIGANKPPQATRQQHDPMMDTASMLVASHASLNSQPGGVSQLHNGEFQPLVDGGAGSLAADSHLDQLYDPLEPEATLEPPANMPGALNRQPNSSRERLVQLSKHFIKSSRRPLDKLMRITNRPQQNNSTTSKSTGGKQQPQGSMAASSQQSISVAQQLGAVVSPAVMMGDHTGGGSMENFNRFALPLQQWFRQHQQQEAAQNNRQQQLLLHNQNKHRQAASSEQQPAALVRIYPINYQQAQLLPLVSHSTIHLSPYSLVADRSQLMPALQPYWPAGMMAARLRADVKAGNESAARIAAPPTASSTSALASWPIRVTSSGGPQYSNGFTPRAPAVDQLLFQGAAKSLLDWSKQALQKGQRGSSPDGSLAATNSSSSSSSLNLLRSRKSLLQQLARSASKVGGTQLPSTGRKLRPSSRSVYQPTILLRRLHPKVERPTVSTRRISDYDQRAGHHQKKVVQSFISTSQHPPAFNATSLWPRQVSTRMATSGAVPPHLIHIHNNKYAQQPVKTMGQIRNVFMPQAQHRELVNSGAHFSFRFPTAASGQQQQQQHNTDTQVANFMAMQPASGSGQNHTDGSEIYSASSNQHSVDMSGAEMDEAVKLNGAAHESAAGAMDASAMDESSFNSLMAAASTTNGQDDLQSLLPASGGGGGYNQQEMHGGKEMSPATSTMQTDAGGKADFGSGGSSIEQQQHQYQQQLLNQQQQQLMYQPDLSNGITMARPRLPKFIPSINSMASKFRQHLFQTFKLNPARWPVLSSASFMSYPKFQPPNFLAPATPLNAHLQVPLPQQHQLRLQAAASQQQQHAQKLPLQQQQQQLILPGGRPHAADQISAASFAYNFGGGPPATSIESLASKPNGLRNSFADHTQQQSAQQQLTTSSSHQFQVSPSLQYQQQQASQMLANRGQYKLNLNGRPSLTASEQAAIQMDGQLPGMMTGGGGSGEGGPQQMVDDNQMMYTDKVPDQQQQLQQAQQQHLHHHHQHHRVPSIGDPTAGANGQTMVEFVQVPMGTATNGSSSPMADETAGADLYDQEMLVADPNSMVGGQEESVASQLANGHELIIPPPTATTTNQAGEQQLVATDHRQHHRNQQQQLPPQHSVMTDVSSNLVTSDGTYIQEEPTNVAPSAATRASRGHQGIRQLLHHQSMGEMSTATHSSESKLRHEPPGGHQEQVANVSTVLHHHNHMIMPVGGSSEGDSLDESQKQRDQQQYQIEQVTHATGQQQQQQVSDDSGSNLSPSSNDYELEQQQQQQQQQQLQSITRPRLQYYANRMPMNNGNKQMARVRLVNGNNLLQQQTYHQKNPAGSRSRLQMNGSSDMASSDSSMPQNADYQIIKANQLDLPPHSIQYINGNASAIGEPSTYGQKSGNRKLLATNGGVSTIQFPVPSQAHTDTASEEQQQQQPLLQQVYEFENQVVASPTGGEQYYESTPSIQSSGDSDSVTMNYGENGTESQQQQQRQQQPTHAIYRNNYQHRHNHNSGTGPHLIRAQVHYRPSATATAMGGANQSDGGIEYHFKSLSGQAEESNSAQRHPSGEQTTDESSGLSPSPPFRYPSNKLLQRNQQQLLQQNTYPIRSSSHTHSIRLNDTLASLLRHQEQGTVGSLSSSSQDQYVLVDQPAIGADTQATSHNQTTVTEVIRQLNGGGGGGNNSLAEQPMIYVSMRPDKVVLPTDQLQQLQQVQQQLQLKKNQQNKRRPVKGPKGAQAKLQWQQQPQMIARATSQQTSVRQGLPFENGTAAGMSSEATQTSSPIVAANSTIPDENLETSQRVAAEIVHKSIKNHNLKPTTTTVAPIVLMRDSSFTRPPKAKIRWQGMLGANRTTAAASGITNGTMTAMRSELNPQETSRADQAWMVNGMTHQTYASNHKAAAAAEQQPGAGNGSQWPAPVAEVKPPATAELETATNVNNSSSSALVRLYQNHKHSSYPDLSGAPANNTDEPAMTAQTTTLSPDIQTPITTAAGYPATEATTPAPSSGDTTTGSPQQQDARVYSHFGLHSSAGRSRQETHTGGGSVGADGSARGRFQTFRSSASRLNNNHKQPAASANPTASPTPAVVAAPATGGGGAQRRDSRTGSTSFRLSSSPTTTTSTSQAPQLPLPVDGSTPMSTSSPAAGSMASPSQNVSTNSSAKATLPPPPQQQSNERPTVFVSSVELGPSRLPVHSVGPAADATGDPTAAPSAIARSGNSAPVEYPSLGYNYTQPDKQQQQQQRLTDSSGVAAANSQASFYGRHNIMSEVGESEMDQLMRIGVRRGLSDEQDASSAPNRVRASFMMSSGDSGLLMPDNSDPGLHFAVRGDDKSTVDNDLINLIAASKHSSDK